MCELHGTFPISTVADQSEQLTNYITGSTQEGERFILELIWSHVLRNVHCLVVIVNCEFMLWELHGTFPIFNSWLFEI